MEFKVGQVKFIIKPQGWSVLFPVANKEVIVNWKPGNEEQAKQFELCLFVFDQVGEKDAST